MLHNLLKKIFFLHVLIQILGQAAWASAGRVSSGGAKHDARSAGGGCHLAIFSEFKKKNGAIRLYFWDISLLFPIK